jgi:maleylacetoacetate isomerase
MELYGYFNSSTSYRVRIALALKGIDFSTHPVDLRAQEQRSAAYLALNPAASVPTLRDDHGLELGQSLAIIDYLDAVQPRPRLIPAEQPVRARVLEFAQAIACDMHPLNNLRVLRYLRQQFGIDDAGRQAWYRHWIAEGMSTLEELLRRADAGPCCFGATPTLADVCLVPQVANAERMGCELSPYPRVLAVSAHCRAQPAFIAAEPARQPDFGAGRANATPR